MRQKVGYAFSDYVTAGHARKNRPNGAFRHHDLILILPIFLGALIFAVLLARLFYVQVLRGDYYSTLANQNRTRTKIIAAPRGIIFDRNGKPLVRNTPAFKILINNKVQLLTHDEALLLASQGKAVQEDIERDYLYKGAAAHVVGYLGQISRDQLLLPKYQNYEQTDFNGKLGLEQQYENILHGANGRALYEVDAQGKPTRSLGIQEPVAGQDVHTTLDVDIQQAVAAAFSPDQKGAAVVSDPRNGEILALYSNPTFDPNLFTHPKNYVGVGKYASLTDLLGNTSDNLFLNRAIAGAYPPGSTFKLITATSALESRAVTEDTVYQDNGVLKVGAFSFSNWYFTEYGGTEGSVTIVKAIKRSNDIYFYQAAAATGPNTIAEWGKKFGMGQKLGIDLAGEVTGIVPTTDWKKQYIHEQWYLGDTYHMGIGQGYVLATPLQVNAWTMPFANGGKVYQPHLVSSQKSVVRNQNFISSNTMGLVREGMREACETGGVGWPFFDFKVPAQGWSASGGKNSRVIDGRNFTEESSGSAKMVRVHVGCKTGTAETDPSSKPHAWITVFAPFYNPEVVVTVLVENSGEGSNIAGPIAKQILTKYFEEKK